MQGEEKRGGPNRGQGRKNLAGARGISPVLRVRMPQELLAAAERKAAAAGMGLADWVRALIAGPRLVAVHGAGDWTDAYVDFLVLPEWMDIESEAAAHADWYRNTYCQALRTGGVKTPAMDLAAWCISRGARKAREDEIAVHWEA